MTTMKTAIAAVWVATAVAVLGMAAPARADDAPSILPLTNDVRAQLLQAGAVLTGRPASEFSGLRPENQYYAYEPNAGNPYYWAAAALEGKTYLAKVYTQDQNSYMLFRKGGDPAATWVPMAVGYGPIPAGDDPCPLPQSIRDVWKWETGKCFPP
ncbi:MAG: hypothetical protein QOG75_6348, partial [Mycobacterium sp.]|nr:hypothetical protein [Mycobacterium sp.]